MRIFRFWWIISCNIGTSSSDICPDISGREGHKYHSANVHGGLPQWWWIRVSNWPWSGHGRAQWLRISCRCWRHRRRSCPRPSRVPALVIYNGPSQAQHSAHRALRRLCCWAIQLGDIQGVECLAVSTRYCCSTHQPARTRRAKTLWKTFGLRWNSYATTMPRMCSALIATRLHATIVPRMGWGGKKAAPFLAK